MELTKEYFDTMMTGVSLLLSSIDSRLTKVEDRLTRVEDRLTRVEDTMVTKEDLKRAAEESRQYTDDAFQTQQTWMDHRFSELVVAYDVRDRVGKLEHEFHEFREHSTAGA